MSTRRHLECDFTRPTLVLGVAILGVCLSCMQSMSAQTVEESQVKAAYLYNFAKFVEWPPGMFPDSESPAVICVVGDDRMSEVLERAVSGKKVNGRAVKVQRPHLAEEFKACHILYIGFGDRDHIAEMLGDLRGSSVLTVGQSGQFISLGGMINLAFKNARIELEIDPDASNAVGLKISSRLLVVARLVKAEHLTGGER